MTGNKGGVGENRRSAPFLGRILVQESSDEIASYSATRTCDGGVVSATVCGAIHERNDERNQDALKWWFAEGKRPLAVLCVADGHGGSEYTRSHIGSRRAVEETQMLLVSEVIPRILDSYAHSDLSQFKRQLNEQMPKLLVSRWRASVYEHATDNPISEDETSDAHDIETAKPNVAEADTRIEQLYGTTLLAALLTPEFHIYIQLGDGDVLTGTAEGEVVRPPFPADNHLLANYTTSLCLKKAWRFVRIHFQPIVEKPPVFVMLATDGYANSFADDEDFREVASDLYNAIRQDGPEAVASQLPDWLKATSKGGSGDDISVVIAANIG